MSLGYLLAPILLLLPEEIQLCEREAGGKLHRAQIPGHQQHLRIQLFPHGKKKINSLIRIGFPYRKNEKSTAFPHRKNGNGQLLRFSHI
jgi:hypothetical protein